MMFFDAFVEKNVKLVKNVSWATKKIYFGEIQISAISTRELDFNKKIAVSFS